MNIVFLETTKNDFIWLRDYYERIFPQGKKQAQQQFKSINKLLKENPLIGHQSEHGNVLEFSIPNTPFAYIYRIKDKQIQVLRVWDERQQKPIE